MRRVRLGVSEPVLGGEREKRTCVCRVACFGGGVVV